MNESPDDEVSADEAGADEAGTVEANTDEVRRLRAQNPSLDANAPEALRRRVEGIPSQESATGRRAWLAVAAAAVVVGMVGTAFAFGSRGGLGGAGGDEVVALTKPAPGEVAPPIGVGGESGGGSSESAGGTREGTGSARSGAADQAAAASVDRLSYASGYWGGRQKFVLPAFDRAQGEATVYALDSAPSFNAETVAHAAKVLGVSGKVKPNKGSAGWRVRSKEGTKPEISLSAWGASEISYSSGLENPVWECIDQTVSPDYENYEDVYQECLRTTPQPTEQQARDAMDTVLEAFGIDASTVSVEIVDDDLEYDNTLLVRASRVVDGMASPLSIETTLAHGGILWAYGSPGELVSLGSYRIVSPAEAAERLNFSAFSPELTYVEPVDPEMLPGAEEVEEPTAPAPVPKRGSAVPWSLAEHEIVSARLGMTAVHGPDRVVYAVPAYEFTDSDGSRWSVIALEETSLDLSRSPGGWWW